jgi:hypothetical protein
MEPISPNWVEEGKTSIVFQAFVSSGEAKIAWKDVGSYYINDYNK